MDMAPKTESVCSFYLVKSGSAFSWVKAAPFASFNNNIEQLQRNGSELSNNQFTLNQDNKALVKSSNYVGNHSGSRSVCMDMAPKTESVCSYTTVGEAMGRQSHGSRPTYTSPHMT